MGLSRSSRKIMLVVVALLLAAGALPPMFAKAETAAKGVVAGTVYEKNGLPAQSATVYVYKEGSNNPSTTSTNARGNFWLNNVEPGNYRVQAKRNYETYTYDSGYSAYAQVAAGETTVYELTIDAVDGAVSGIVKDGNGNPLPGAKMYLYKGSSTSSSVTVEADSRGMFLFPKVAAGEYRTKVSTGIGPYTFESEFSSPVAVSAGTTAQAGELTAVPTKGAVAAAVAGPNGEPINSATVNLYRDGSSVSAANVRTDNAGDAMLKNVAPGTYQAKATYSTFFYNYESELSESFEVTPGNLAASGSLNLKTGQGAASANVTDADGNPVANALVYLYKGSTSVSAASGYTNVNGNVFFTKLAPGPYRMVVNFRPATVTYTAESPVFDVRAGEVAANSLRLADYASATKLTGFKGTVTDADGNLIYNATVYLYRASGTGHINSTSTDYSGNYSFRTLEPGEYRVQARYNNGNYTMLSEFSDIVAVSSGLEVVDLKMAPTNGQIAGKVTDDTGAPVEAATVYLYQGDRTGDSGFTATGAAGNYLFWNREPGDYRVQAAYNTALYTFKSEFSPKRAVVPGETTTIHLTASPVKGAAVGTVRDRDGNPVEGATVYLYKDGATSHTAYSTTNSLGNFAISRVDAGTYRVKAKYYDSNYTYESELSSELYTIANGQATLVKDLSLSPTNGAIIGEVVDEEGKPVKDAKIYLYAGDNGYRINSTDSDGLGQYQFRQIDVGEYRVKAVYSDGTYSYESSDSAHFVVNRGDSAPAERLTLRVIRGAVTGTVKNASGQPVKDASVSLYKTGSTYSSSSALTDASGKFNLNAVEPGQYQLKAIYSDATYSYASDLSGPFRIETGQTVQAGDIVIRVIDGAAAGTVVKLDGAPVSNVEVTLYKGADAIARAFTDQDGKFLHAKRTPGDYRIKAAYEDSLYKYTSDFASLQISAGQTTTLPPLTVIPIAGAVEGTITDKDGQPLGASEVRLFKEGGTSPSARTETGADGSYRFAKLEPGRYRIEAAEVVSEPFAVTAGQTQEVNLSASRDVVPPATSYDLKEVRSNDGRYIAALNVTLRANEAGAKTEYRINGGAWKAYGGSFTVYPETTETLEWRSIDKAGNVERIWFADFNAGTINQLP
ncbi:carboxypeptidase regulatory-like domain-containing protein [Cohnella massiliensis]|uniref:carboxypeptidase regulatory-like domain-containing protein n=1 Tax=Cohnella massiliensis TaxID=1816691 RepID=UPI0009B99420|nr:carboxypeptidase regulatory-like domain-containing protein [Cohnella massiliensis]